MPDDTAIGIRCSCASPAGASRGVGRSIRDAGESWAFRRRGACHRFHYRAGAPPGRRKWGNQNQEALGRSEDIDKFLGVPESGFAEAALANNEKAASFKGKLAFCCAATGTALRNALKIFVSPPKSASSGASSPLNTYLRSIEMTIQLPRSSPIRSLSISVSMLCWRSDNRIRNVSARSQFNLTCSSMRLA